MKQVKEIVELSQTQKKVLRIIGRYEFGEKQLAAYGNAPLLSAAHALMRKGFVDSRRTGFFHLTKAGEPIAKKLIEEFNQRIVIDTNILEGK